MTSCGSLPPLLESSIEGELHFIILRPVLFPALLPNQSLEFLFTWYGSSSPCRACLTPDDNEIKLQFDINCDGRGFRRYLRDANNLKVYMKVKGEGARTGSSPPSRLPRNQYTLRNRKEWRDGDHIGSFVMSNLKLNTKGWYVRECTINDNFDECCGSIHVYMVHSHSCESETQPSSVPEKKTTEALPKSKLPIASPVISGKKLADARPLNNKSTHANQPIAKKRDPQQKQIAMTKSSPLKGYKQMPNKNPVTDFLPSKVVNQTKAIKNNSNEELKLANSDNRCVAASPEEDSNSMPRFTNERKKLLSHLPANKSKPEFLLTELFSLVDSRVISKVELPILMQLYQGQSPSCDFDAEPLLNRYRQEVFPKSVDESSNPNKGKMPSFSPKGDESISGISPLDSSNSKSKVVFSPSREERAPSLTPKSGKGSASDYPAQDVASTKVEFQEFPQESPLKDVPESCSVMILELDSLVLNVGNLGIPDLRQDSKVSIPVRQRSKVCYIVHFIFHFASKMQEEEAVFVSRRVESGVVQFHSSTTVKLPSLDEMSDGVLKIMVIRRTLGIKLGEEVAFSVILLKEITHCSLSTYAVKLWLPSKAGISMTNLSSLKNPIGRLCFRAAFAASPQNTLGKKCLSEQDEDAHQATQHPHITPEDQEGSYAQFVHSNLLAHSEDFEDHSLHRLSVGGDASRREDSESLSRRGCASVQPPSPMTKRESKETQTPSRGSLGDLRPERSLGGGMKSRPIVSQENKVSRFSDGVAMGQCEDSQRNVITSRIGEPTSENLIHLEILEAQNLPRIELASGDSFEPCCYTKSSSRGFSIETSVVPFSCNPVWSFEVDVDLQFQDLKQTNGHLIIKIYHCVQGVRTHLQDPLIGFASIDTTSLQGGLVSLCGWFSLLNLQGRKCGKIKVSLTPHESSDESASGEVFLQEPTKAKENLRFRFEMEMKDKADSTYPESTYHKLSRLSQEQINYPTNEPPHTSPEEKRVPHCPCCPASRGQSASTLDKKNADSTLVESGHQISQHSPSTSVEEDETLTYKSEDSSYRTQGEKENQKCTHHPPNPVLRVRDIDFSLRRSLSSDSYILDERRLCLQEKRPLQPRSNSVNVLEEIPPERLSNVAAQPIGSPRHPGSVRRNSPSGSRMGLNPVLDTFCWMNRMKCNLDSPSASYISVYSRTVSHVEVREEFSQAKTKPNALPKCVRKRKTRIAAQLNFY